MAKQTINNGTLANDNTGDTLRGASTKINANFTEIYNILGGSTPTSTITLGASSIISEGASADDFETTLAFANTTSSDKTITLPDLTGTVSLITATETLTNKTLTTPTLTTPKINDTSGHTYNLAVSNLAANRTITLPLLAGADEFTFNAHTQTLTNKTLTSPILTTPKVLQYTDTNGNETIKTAATSSAVNFLTVTNSATNTDVSIGVDGTDTNVDLSITPKGTGHIFYSGLPSPAIETLSGSGAASLTIPLTLISNGGSTSVTIGDGPSSKSALKKFVNIGAGVTTITVGSGASKFENGTTVALAKGAVAELIWTGAIWVLTNQATSGTVPALTVA
jgi:hypothetical protein